MLYRRLRTVPVAKSVQWEAKVLGEVTSSTAVRLGGGSRGESVLQKEEEERSGIVENEVNGAGGEEKEGERKKENYVACLGRGAKPIWKRGKEHTILLDNNTTFTKVKQSLNQQDMLCAQCDDGRFWKGVTPSPTVSGVGQRRKTSQW